MKRWIKISTVSGLEAQLGPQNTIVVNYKGQKVILVKSEKGFSALQYQCSHLGASLKDARIYNGQIICPLHEYRFDVFTGRECQDRSSRLKRYPLKIENDQIWIEM